MAAERQAEFTCTIPALRLNQQQQHQQQQQQENEQVWPEVGWKRNGLPLQVRWLNNNGEDTAAVIVSADSSPGYLARKTKANEFVLTLTRVQLKDDNATFTCQYKLPDGVSAFSSSSSSSDEPLQLAEGSTPDLDNLARESSPVRLRVHASQVKIVTDLAPPIENLANAKNPHELANNQTTTTTTSTKLLTEPTPTKSGGLGASLRQTLEDLFELAKPALIFLGLLSLISSFVLVHLTLIKRKTRNQNRYMKHQYVGSDASSGASSAIGGAPDCGDPVLSSLMARTLSAPSAVSLAGATKKYRSYRDHLRKVAAVQDMIVGAEGDFVDGYFGPPPALSTAAHLRGQQISGSLSDQAHLFALPNLYNQSLAAREQARNLLQANEHVRSLSNLSSQHQKQHQAANNATQIRQQMGALGQMGSHLNLPLSFALGGANGRPDQASCQSNMASALWPLHTNPDPNQQQQQQQHAIARSSQQQQQQQRNSNQQSNKHRLGDEHYQLVNCNGSIVADQFSGHMIHNQNNSQPEMPRQQQHSNCCTICDKELSNRYLLRMHMLKVHQINLEIEDEELALSERDNDRNDFNDEQQRHSSPSISVATSSNSATNDQEINSRTRRKQGEFGDIKCVQLGEQQARLDSSSQNHYSTIESNDDDEEDRYEEVEQTSKARTRMNRVSSFVMADEQHEQHIDNQSSVTNNNNNILKNSTRFSIMSNSSSSGCGDSTNTTTSSSLSGADTAANGINPKRGARQNQNKLFLKQDNKRSQHFQDQLSPYAVSSICNNIPPNHQPPPVPDSEAMKALYEQFDINQLMLLDESNSSQQTLPFDTLPPPPPPPPNDSLSSSHTNNRAIKSQTRKKT